MTLCSFRQVQCACAHFQFINRRSNLIEMNFARSGLLVMLAVCALICVSTSGCFADSGPTSQLTYKCGARITANSPVIGGTRYGRLIRLQYNGGYNGNLIATFEAWPNNYGIYRSTDDGLSWTQIVAPLLSSTPGWKMQVEPDLFE